MIEDSGWVLYIFVGLLVGMPALVGIGILGTAARRWWRRRALAASGERATARVVDNQLESRSNGRTTFRPVVTFRTSTGADVTAVLADLSDFRSHVAGTQIDVLYDPERPADAAPARRSGAGLVVAVVFGLFFLAFSLMAYLTGRAILSGFDFFAGGV